jgi:hypothetical protein
VSQAAQIELGFEVIEGGSYEIGGSKATWKPRDKKIIDLTFGRKKLKVTREGRGVAGNPRFHVNGYTQPDGKLLQGRSIPELVRKLYRFGSAIVRRLDRIEQKMDARFDRLEKTIARGKGGRAAGQSKLCAAPVKVEWEQRRYVPRNALGAFARVPEPLIDGSRQMASGEYRLLQAVLIVAQGSGLLTAGKYRLAELAKIDPADVKRCRDSLVNRGILRPTGKKLPRGMIEYELLTHPWLIAGDLTDGWGEESTMTGGNDAATGGTVPPNKTSQKKKREDESPPREAGSKTGRASHDPPQRTRALSSGEDSKRFARDEDHVGDEVWQSFCTVIREAGRSSDELVRNGAAWLARWKASRGALALAVEDWKVMTPAARAKIGNPGAYIVSRYEARGGNAVSKS